MRRATLDLGNCTFCGLCAKADGAIRMTRDAELAAKNRQDLVATAKYELKANGTQGRLAALASRFGKQAVPEGASASQGAAAPHTAISGHRASGGASLEAVGSELKAQIDKVLGRSLHIREVDAGSCNGCEVEIVGLSSPVYDAERLGIHFVASPRHADMLLVTGSVSRNMELALRKTYDATPEPRLVVAVGACGCAGGIFGRNYASLGGVDRVIPVDVYIPGCPPNPHALLHGILLAIGRLAAK
jgi:Ni,Fe-hydrogenase III small subunit